MFFASDNTGPAHPEVMAALGRANEGFATPYGGDTLTAAVQARLREVFEAPRAAVYLVATGTAANALALSVLGQPWQTVFCAPHAHIQEDECNAPEFYSGGAKLTLVEGEDRIGAEALSRAIAAEQTRGVHGPQRGPVSITQATERGTVYSLAEIEAIGAVTQAHGLPLHMDGARFANALATLGCSPAEMTWKRGVDALSFGATKNGCLGVEAVILFDPAHAWEFELRRKRGAHLFSKHRYLAAQMMGYLDGDLWRRSGARANANCARLAEGLRDISGVGIAFEPQANIIFCTFARALHRRLHEAGAQYNIWDGDLDGDDPDAPLTARLVCDWSISHAEIDRFLDVLRG
ncbi:L-threonine aldolase [Salinihabitans flavidus]|uniref:L-threonine aldolase n=1 Tax=Salinihabitans flavidus TaxID=569882 RepID=A0A1H8SHD6_9RHOB|nr:low specificity L-threonine aldolase [Salinihabitans flavidus]SEO77936.1 L-threonine aldolase [Salinihabitans flavidus]